MCVRLEKGWWGWEQPLILFSFILHPSYRFDKFNTTLPKLNWVDFGQLLIYYYCAWKQSQPVKILREFGLVCKENN
nr:8171_t:CDS:2 [Entrophospora candida]